MKNMRSPEGDDGPPNLKGATFTPPLGISMSVIKLDRHGPKGGAMSALGLDWLAGFDFSGRQRNNLFVERQMSQQGKL